MKNGKSVGRNYIYNLSYQILAVILPLVTTPYLSRVLGPAAIGSYSYTFSIVTYFSIFGILGLNTFGQLQISKNRDNKKDISNNFWSIFFSKAMMTFIAIFLYFVLIFFSTDYKILFECLVLVLISNIFDISWFFIGIEEIKKIVFRNFIIKILGLILIFTLVKKPSDIYLYAIILNGATLLGNFTFWISLKKYVSKPCIHKNDVLINIKKSLPFFIPTIASTIYTMVDKSMLSWIVNSDYQNGIYEQAHKIELAALTVVTSLSTVLLPRTAYLFKTNQKEEYTKYVKSSINFVLFLATPIVFGLIGVSKPLVIVFLGSGYEECISILRVFSVLVLLSGINTIIGNQCLVARDKQKKYNIGVISGAFINVVLNLFLIYNYESLGAAIASVIAELAIFIVFIFYTKDILSFKSILKKAIKPLIASLLMGISVFCISYFLKINILSLVIEIIVGAIIYILFMIILRDKTLFKILNLIRYKIFQNKE